VQDLEIRRLSMLVARKRSSGGEEDHGIYIISREALRCLCLKLAIGLLGMALSRSEGI